MPNEQKSYVEEWEKQVAYAIKNQDAIRKEYGNNYIAVKDCQVIDSDRDQFKLAARIEKEFRREFVLISTIEDIVNPKEDRLESPEDYQEI